MAFHFKPDGEGSYLPGIPARSLSDEEYDALSAEQQEAVKHSRLYEAAAVVLAEPVVIEGPAVAPVAPMPESVPPAP